MAKIIENNSALRRIIKLSTDDIVAVVREYQRIVPRFTHFEQVREYLDDAVIYIPEEV